MSGPGNGAPIIIKRKKVSGGDGHHGGAWKVAYADFVTAMMAFFLLMWLLSATTEKQRKGLADYFSPSIPIHRVSGGSDGAFGGSSVFAAEDLLQDGVGASETNPTDSNKAKGSTGYESAEAEAKDKEAFETLEEALTGRTGESMVSEEAMKHIVTKVTDEGLIIELFAQDGAPLFDPGTDTPTPLLRDLATMVARVAGLVDNRIAVGGHLRANPVVLAQNPVWELSSSRAARTRGLLESGGIDAARIKRVTGHADRSLAEENPMSLRNNRIEIILLRTGRD